MAAKANTMNGGFWNAPQPHYSQQTQSLLKDMMKESKLTNFQQRHLEKTLRSGSSLPTKCAPTSSARPKAQKPVKTQSKILNPKNYQGGVRSKNTMEALGAFEKPEYSLPTNNGRDIREKEKLANIMAFGQDIDELQIKRGKAKVELEDNYVTVDRFDELNKEVEERKQFLENMTRLGKAKEYKTVIETEISQLVREMELIDNKRTQQLEKLIKLKDTENQS